MIRRPFILLFLFFLHTSPTSAQNPILTQWLDQNALSITTPVAENGFEDLLPLKQTLSDTRLLALGEATHGTREFFQLKHRLLEFAVEELGFRAFAMEAGFSECLQIDSYVQGGPGDPQALVHGLQMWPWITEEVLELVEWMRKYNADKAPGDRIHFRGFDMQSPYMAAQAIAQMLTAEAPELSEQYAALLERLSVTVLYALTENEKKGLQQETALLNGDYQALLQSSKRHSEAEKAVLRLHGVALEQAVRNVNKIGTGYRDSCMAANVKALLGLMGTEGKVVLWAHNGHIRPRTFVNFTPMGKWLKDQYGKAYYAIGFDFGSGSFRAYNLESKAVETFEVEGIGKSAYWKALTSVDGPACFIDLHQVQEDEKVAKVFSKSSRMRRIGAVYNAKKPNYYFAKKMVQTQYDGLIFLDHGTASRPLPEPSD